MTVEALRAALDHPNVAAFLRVIRAGETHPDDDESYAAVFGWRPGNGVTFSDFTDHPRRAIKSPWGWTSAAGAYQAMCAVPPLVKTDTWGDFVRWCAGHDYAPKFGQADQDLFAAWCIRRRGALEDVIAGRLEAAVHKCAKEWASFPGSPYGQPTKTMPQLLAVYKRFGGSLVDAPNTSAEPVEAPAENVHVETEWDLQNPAPVPQPKAPMTPFLIPAVVELAKLLPKLGGMFGGSEVAQRNVAAASVVVDAVVGAVGAANAQEAVERIQADPAAREAAAKAVEGVWFQIAEAGGGGIAGARQASLAYAMPDGPRFWLNPSFWISLILIAMPFMLLVDVFYVHPESYQGDIRVQIVTGVLMIVSLVAAYWIGTSHSSAKKDERRLP